MGGNFRSEETEMPSSRRRLWAVVVLVAGIATILSVRSLGSAAGEALRRNQCEGVTPGWSMLQLELGLPVPALQGNDAHQVGCVLTALWAELHADFAFLLSYSVLVFAIFAFLSTPAVPLEARPRSWGEGRWLLAVGASLSTAMLLGDALENHTAFRLLELAEPAKRAVFGRAFEEALPAMTTITSVKWAALALSCLVIGAVYLVRWLADWRRPLPALGIVVTVFGVIVACFFFRALDAGDPRLLARGMTYLAYFWIAILFHAVYAAIFAGREQRKLSQDL